MPTSTRNYFVVPEKLEEESLGVYLERVLLAYDSYRLSFIGEDAQGHNQVIEVTSSGNYDVLIKFQHRITYVYVNFEDGSYTFDLKLNVDKPYGIRDGDVVEFYFDAPLTASTVRVLDQDNQVLYTKTFDTTGNDSEFKKFINFNQQWRS